jgi:ribosomal protein L24
MFNAGDYVRIKSTGQTGRIWDCNHKWAHVYVNDELIVAKQSDLTSHDPSNNGVIAHVEINWWAD